MPATVRDYTRLKVPRELKRDHRKKGGKSLRRWVCHLNRGVIRVMVGWEPAGDNGEFVWHVSVSVAETDSVMSPPIRKPSDVECEAGCELVTTKRQWTECDNGTMVRHFFDG